MITTEQKKRAEREFTTEFGKARTVARAAELDLEHYAFLSSPEYRPEVHQAKRAAFDEADYLAESRAYISQLIRADLSRRKAVPDTAVCFFRDGDQWCCVNADFMDLMASPSGFGESFDEALEELRKDIVSRAQKSLEDSAAQQVIRERNAALLAPIA